MGGITGDRGESKRYRILADSTRRAVLGVLGRTAPPADLEALASQTAVVRYSSDEPSEGVVARTELVLHHNHLPRLADAGLIEYDRDRNS